MEFVKEKNAFRHYNAAGEMDAEITYASKGEGVIEANHTFVSSHKCFLNFTLYS